MTAPGSKVESSSRQSESSFKSLSSEQPPGSRKEKGSQNLQARAASKPTAKPKGKNSDTEAAVEEKQSEEVEDTSIQEWEQLLGEDFRKGFEDQGSDYKFKQFILGKADLLSRRPLLLKRLEEEISTLRQVSDDQNEPFYSAEIYKLIRDLELKKWELSDDTINYELNALKNRLKAELTDLETINSGSGYQHLRISKLRGEIQSIRDLQSQFELPMKVKVINSITSVRSTMEWGAMKAGELMSKKFSNTQQRVDQTKGSLQLYSSVVEKSQEDSSQDEEEWVEGSEEFNKDYEHQGRDYDVDKFVKEQETLLCKRPLIFKRLEKKISQLKKNNGFYYPPQMYGFMRDLELKKWELSDDKINYELNALKNRLKAEEYDLLNAKKLSHQNRRISKLKRDMDAIRDLQREYSLPLKVKVINTLSSVGGSMAWGVVKTGEFLMANATKAGEYFKTKMFTLSAGEGDESGDSATVEPEEFEEDNETEESEKPQEQQETKESEDPEGDEDSNTTLESEEEDN